MVTERRWETMVRFWASTAEAMWSSLYGDNLRKPRIEWLKISSPNRREDPLKYQFLVDSYPVLMLECWADEFCRATFSLDDNVTPRTYRLVKERDIDIAMADFSRRYVSEYLCCAAFLRKYLLSKYPLPKGSSYGSWFLYVYAIPSQMDIVFEYVIDKEKTEFNPKIILWWTISFLYKNNSLISNIYIPHSNINLSNKFNNPSEIYNSLATLKHFLALFNL